MSLGVGVDDLAGARPENSASMIATRPRTIWASESPWKIEPGRRPSHCGRQPDLADAAGHLPVGVWLLGERRQRLAQFDDIAIAVLPFVEEGKIVADRLDRRWS